MATLAEIIGGAVSTNLTASPSNFAPSAGYSSSQVTYPTGGITLDNPVTVQSQNYVSEAGYGEMVGSTTFNVLAMGVLDQITSLAINTTDTPPMLVGLVELDNLSSTINQHANVTITFTLSAFDPQTLEGNG